MRALVVALLLGLGSPSLAADMTEVGDLVIRDPWVRASLGNAPNSVAYMTIESEGDAPDRLIGGETPVARRVALHRHVMEDGIARMRPVEAIEIAPGAPAVLEPGGLHVMLMGLEEKLEVGATVPLTLTFERAGSVELEVPVRGMSGGARHGGTHDGSAPD